MALDNALAAAFAASGVRIFHALQIKLPTGDLNLIDGVAVVKFSVDGADAIFTGEHPIFGTINAIGEMTEAVATSAPRLSFSLLPPTSDAIGYLCQPEVQGVPIRIWIGSVSATTGLVVGLPELIWSGMWDVAVETITAGPPATRVVDIESASSFDRLMITGEGARLSDQWQQSFYPGDDCLKWNSSIERTVAWGAEIIAPSSNAYPGSISGGTGGSYGGGGGGPGHGGPIRWSGGYLF